MTVKLDEDQVGTEKRKAEVVEYAHVVPKTITYGGEVSAGIALSCGNLIILSYFSLYLVAYLSYYHEKMIKAL